MTSLASPSAALDAQSAARQLLDSSIDTAPQFSFQGHGFVIDSVGFLLPASLRCELVEDLQLCPLPGTAGWLLGMTHLRGKILPVFELRRLVFSIARTESQNRYLFIDPLSQGFAVRIASMPYRLNLQAHQRMTRNTGVPEVLLPFCLNIYHQDRIWIELDYKAFFRQQTQSLLTSVN